MRKKAVSMRVITVICTKLSIGPLDTPDAPLDTVNPRTETSETRRNKQDQNTGIEGDLLIDQLWNEGRSATSCKGQRANTCPPNSEEKPVADDAAPATDDAAAAAPLLSSPPLDRDEQVAGTIRSNRPDDDANGSGRVRRKQTLDLSLPIEEDMHNAGFGGQHNTPSTAATSINEAPTNPERPAPLRTGNPSDVRLPLHRGDESRRSSSSSFGTRVSSVFDSQSPVHRQSQSE